MRLFLISLAAVLLAAGCANNRPGSPDMAPSAQAQLNSANSGWSVPPGQKHASQPTAQQPAGEAAVANADHAKSGQASNQAMQQPDQQSQAKPQQPLVKPLVPAFPVRMEEDRVTPLQTVHFGFDDWNLTPQARALLDANARWMKANPQVNVKVAGNCDERGSPEYNLALGERRANRVRDYLIEHGVPADNMITVSYGEEMPVDPGHDAAAWAKNRRVDFTRTDGRQVSGDERTTPSS
ncbi:MAG TPA: peptidoglycan-associated lipoprotein Pal [bacterium]|nr:peptidoglycan-associated lipoprotein Pal [bacterium]